MKALKIALFACVFSVFFSFTAFADTITTQPIQPGETVEVNLTASIAANNPSADSYLNGYFTARLNNYGSFKLLGAAVTSVGSNAPSITGTGAVTSQNETQANGTFSANFGRSYNGTVYLYVNVTATIQNINTYAEQAIFVLSTSGTSTGNGNVSGLTINNNINTAQTKLDQILAALGASPGGTDFLGDDALFYFDSRYFNSVYVPNGSFRITDKGYFAITSPASSNFFFSIYNTDNTNGAPVSGLLSPGTYYGVLSIKAPALLDGISFENISSNSYKLDVLPYNEALGYRYFPFILTVKDAIAFPTLVFSFGNLDSALNDAVIFGGVIPADDDYLAGEALNPDQETKRDELENQGEQQAQQEEQLWQNVNSYKGQIDFSLASWSEATSGLSYVSSIFMAIWNNSPNQIITFSLMLGIGMLAIGRGVRAAVSQKGGDDG